MTKKRKKNNQQTNKTTALTYFGLVRTGIGVDVVASGEDVISCDAVPTVSFTKF